MLLIKIAQSFAFSFKKNNFMNIIFTNSISFFVNKFSNELADIAK
jgi:hypothetical protein